MSYKYSTGSVRRGDIYFEDDRTGEKTYIDFGQDTITLRPSGSQVLHAQSDAVGINTTSPDYTLDVAGAASIDDYIYHNGDANTYIGFPSVNKVNLVANGHSFLKYDGDILINNANRDRDTKIMADDGAVILHVDAGKNMVGVNTTTPGSGLHVDSSFATALSVKSSDYTLTVDDHTILADCSNGNVTLTLPTAVGCAGRMYVIKRIDATNNAANINAAGSEEIDGSTNPASVPGLSSIMIQSDNSGWWKVAEYINVP